MIGFHSKVNLLAFDFKHNTSFPKLAIRQKETFQKIISFP